MENKNLSKLEYERFIQKKQTSHNIGLGGGSGLFVIGIAMANAFSLIFLASGLLWLLISIIGKLRETRKEIKEEIKQAPESQAQFPSVFVNTLKIGAFTILIIIFIVMYFNQ